MVKYTYNNVKKIYEENKCVLLENSYISKRTKMKFICECKMNVVKRLKVF